MKLINTNTKYKSNESSEFPEICRKCEELLMQLVKIKQHD